MQSCCGWGVCVLDRGLPPTLLPHLGTAPRAQLSWTMAPFPLALTLILAACLFLVGPDSVTGTSEWKRWRPVPEDPIRGAQGLETNVQRPHTMTGSDASLLCTSADSLVSNLPRWRKHMWASLGEARGAQGCWVGGGSSLWEQETGPKAGRSLCFLCTQQARPGEAGDHSGGFPL